MVHENIITYIFNEILKLELNSIQMENYTFLLFYKSNEHK